MKFLVCLAFVTVVGVYALTDEQKEKLNKVSKECREKTGVSEEIVNKLRSGEYPDEPKAKEQVLCVSKKLGLATEKGEFNMDILKSKIKKVSANDEEAQKILEKCAVKKNSPEQTAFDTFKCLHENKPKFSPVD